MERRRALAVTSLSAAMLLLAATARIAAAAGFVDDGARMLKPETVSAINDRDAQLKARTCKAVTVVTVKTTNGVPVQAAAAAEARKRSLNGALIYIAFDKKQVSISYAADTAALFPPALQTSIKQALGDSFRTGGYDDGVITAVDSISGVIAGGPSGGHGPQMPAPVTQPAPQSGPFGIGWIWWVLIAIVVILIARGLARRPAPGGDEGSSR